VAREAPSAPIRLFPVADDDESTRPLAPEVDDSTKLAEIYRDHFDFVYRVAKRLGGNKLDAEDVAQEVFVVVSRRLDSYDAAAAQVTSWLYGITFNVVRALRRRLRVELSHRADEADGRDVPVVSLETAELQEAWRVARDVLATMAPKKRDVFVLAEFEGLTCGEIGRIVGAPEETIWSRLHYARRDFARKLAMRQKRCQSEVR
jgi:RNA polymerase sigma-70 factor (ECF subfamily)